MVVKKPREQIMLKMYEEGRTLQEIAYEFSFSRSRAQQIIIKEIKKIIEEEFNFIPSSREEEMQLNVAAKERMADIYLTRRKLKNEYRDKEIIARIKSKMKKLPHYSTFSTLYNYANALEENSIDVKKYFPEIANELFDKSRNRWSRYYNSCRECGTTAIKHQSYGLCRNCYIKSDIFKEISESSRLRNKEKWKEKQKKYAKEYHKRPRVIAKTRKKQDLIYFSGNREKTIKRDNYKCTICSLSREDSYKKHNRDFYVKRIKGKSNNLDNLVALCFNCFQKKMMKIMREKLKNKTRKKIINSKYEIQNK